MTQETTPPTKAGEFRRKRPTAAADPEPPTRRPPPRRRFRRLIGVLALGTLLLAFAPPGGAARAQSVADVVAGEPRLATLARLLQRANLLDALATGGPITLLAPTDAAFALLPDPLLEALRADPETLRLLADAHTLEGIRSLARLDGPVEARAVDGSRLLLSAPGLTPAEAPDPVLLAHLGLPPSHPLLEAASVETELRADNGHVWLLDRPLLVPALVAALAGREAPPADGAATVQRAVVAFAGSGVRGHLVLDAFGDGTLATLRLEPPLPGAPPAAATPGVGTGVRPPLRALLRAGTCASAAAPPNGSAREALVVFELDGDSTASGVLATAPDALVDRPLRVEVLAGAAPEARTPPPCGDVVAPRREPTGR